MMQKIMLATDFSESADRAMDIAAMLTVKFAARITVLHAYQHHLVEGQIFSGLTSFREFGTAPEIRSGIRHTVPTIFGERGGELAEAVQEAVMMHKEAATRRIRSELTRVGERLLELGAQNVALIDKEGPTVEVILGAADDEQPDMLILGARGRGSWQGAVLGSVSMALTQRAECPVLVVK